ncbi:DNA-binding protein WhiA [Candidatus Epulonipiscium viviparus]|uniref:DNA-binding protein WhiA n=1 Tax=Candidatus Epulonipiscium viviparus TaxID=420336 RepID=UPI0027380582|nr:DNA-binding protein WhiA [Candidatus Epulopiscium viviparus]
MSFCLQIKEELIGIKENLLEELQGFIFISEKIEADKSVVILEIANYYKKYANVLKKWGFCTMDFSDINKSKKNLFTLTIDNAKMNIDDLSKFSSKRAFIRGLFLGGGTLTDPKKAYHLEFIAYTKEKAEFIQHLLNTMGIATKVVKRRNNFIVYLKESSSIVDLLNIMGAHIALLEFENIRVVKEVRNHVNRSVNCELANISKTVSSAIMQLDDIKFLMKTIGLNHLPSNLEELAQLRLEYTEATLGELGSKLKMPVSKSCVSNRFKKIRQIAEETRRSFR